MATESAVENQINRQSRWQKTYFVKCQSNQLTLLRKSSVTTSCLMDVIQTLPGESSIPKKYRIRTDLSALLIIRSTIGLLCEPCDSQVCGFRLNVELSHSFPASQIIFYSLWVYLSWLSLICHSNVFS